MYDKNYLIGCCLSYLLFLLVSYPVLSQLCCTVAATVCIACLLDNNAKLDISVNILITV